MFILAVRYKSLGQNHAWRFTPSANKSMANIVLFEEDGRTIKDFKAALTFVFFGQEDQRITEAAVQLTDDSDDNWIIERTMGRLRVARNGKILQSEALTQVVPTSILGLDSTKTSSSGLLRHFKLKINDGMLVATDENRNQPHLLRLQQHVEQERTSITNSVFRKLFQTEGEFVEPGLEFLFKLEPLFYANREVLKQKRTLLAHSKDAGAVDPNILTQLENEFEIIKSIERLAVPLLDPAHSLKALRERISKIESDLNRELSGTGVSDLELKLSDAPLEKLISCLSKLEAFDRLIQASEKIQQLCSERTDRVQIEYLETMEQFLSHDLQITSELESCLSTLSLQARSAPSEQAPMQSFVGLIKKFIKPSLETSPHEAEESQAEKQAKLETSRLSVDFALARLGELHANLAEAKINFSQVSRSLVEHHESLVREYGKIKSLWQRLAKENNLPVGISLAELLRLCVKQAQIIELQALRAHHKHALQDRKNQLRRVEELLLEWRKVSQSQKDTPLSNSAIILSEAQSVIRFKQTKESQLVKMKELRDQCSALHALQQNVNARENQIKSAWLKLFTEVHRTVVEPENVLWPEVFAAAHQAHALDRVLGLDKRDLVGGEVFGRTASDACVTVYEIPAGAVSQISALQTAVLGQTIEGIAIVSATDKQICEMLVAAGVSRSRLLPPSSPTNGAKDTDNIALNNAVDERDRKLRALLQTLTPKKNTTTL